MISLSFTLINYCRNQETRYSKIQKQTYYCWNSDSVNRCWHMYQFKDWLISGMSHIRTRIKMHSSDALPSLIDTSTVAPFQLKVRLPCGWLSTGNCWKPWSPWAQIVQWLASISLISQWGRSCNIGWTRDAFTFKRLRGPLIAQTIVVYYTKSISGKRGIDIIVERWWSLIEDPILWVDISSFQAYWLLLRSWRV